MNTSSPNFDQTFIPNDPTKSKVITHERGKNVVLLFTCGAVSTSCYSKCRLA